MSSIRTMTSSQRRGGTIHRPSSSIAPHIAELHRGMLARNDVSLDYRPCGDPVKRDDDLRELTRGRSWRMIAAGEEPDAEVGRTP